MPWGVGHSAERGFYYKPEAERVREAFRRFLAGNHSYLQLSKLVGVTPRGMHLVLRNPIWMGWRVIDKKRDTSAAGKYAGINGRQADRRKIARAPEEIIRVQVIKEPLIPESDFQTVQRIMDLKQAKHWRSRPGVEHRFTYNGFLTCSACGEVVHTALARRDYYICKGRRTKHLCTTKYMGREKLEATLDRLFVDRLTNTGFLEQCIGTLKSRYEQNDCAVTIQRLTSEISSLSNKRTRVVDGFIEGMLSREDRDRRLSTIEHDIQVAQDILMRAAPAASLSVSQLVEAFAPLLEWEHWTRDQKRSVLSTIVPDIRVANYAVESLGLSPAAFSNESIRRDTGSWPLPA